MAGAKSVTSRNDEQNLGASGPNAAHHPEICDQVWVNTQWRKRETKTVWRRELSVEVGTLDKVYSEVSFIAFRLAFTSFFTNVIGTCLPTGKLTMAFVVA